MAIGLETSTINIYKPFIHLHLPTDNLLLDVANFFSTHNKYKYDEYDIVENHSLMSIIVNMLKRDNSTCQYFYNRTTRKSKFFFLQKLVDLNDNYA